MAKELLKEAIADAKAVREVALQNAKMALEEAFDSKIKNMLSAKLSEEIEDDDELEETYMEDEKEETSEAMSYGEDEDVDEEINLDELMAELDEVSDEEEKDTLKEGIDPSFIMGFVDTLEVIISSVGGSLSEFARLIAEGTSGGQMIPMVTRVLLVFQGLFTLAFAGSVVTMVLGMAKAALTPIVKKFSGLFKGGAEASTAAGAAAGATDASGETAMNENVAAAAADPKAFLIDFFTKEAAKQGGSMNEEDKEETSEAMSYDEDEDVDENIDIDALIAEIEDEDEADLEEGATGYDEKVGGKGRTGFDNKPGGKGGTGYDSKKVKKLKEERNAAIATVRSLKESISEMNLLNSKLLYCNKLFRSNALTEAQKVKVVDALDMANTANEAKLVFTTLQESFNFTGVEKRAIKEGLGRASKASGNAPKKVITESVDETVSRFQKLANIKF